MKTYTIEGPGAPATSTSMAEALQEARRQLGAYRVYRGAEYQTDRPGKNGDREYCMALDIWSTMVAARNQTDGQAPVVISWA